MPHIGGLIFGLTTSLASRASHEILFEDLDEAIYPNPCSPDETIGSISFIKSQGEHVSGDIERVAVRTIGLKNIDVARELKDLDLPTSLFTGPMMKPIALESLLKKSAPQLSNSIVCIADRVIYRQAPKHVPFLL